MNDFLVFAHMMKTAGTSVSKHLIAHFGKLMHIVPGGLKMNHDYYKVENLEKDLIKLNKNIKIISGHPMRPYLDFGDFEENMMWFTFFREPTNRYVSHYLHDYKWSRHFSYDRYKNMENKSIIEWEKLEKLLKLPNKIYSG